MALTDAQKADVRRYAGYPQVGANHTVDASRDFSYGWTLPGVWETLASVLDNLRPENEAVLISKFLTPLGTLETAIYGAGDNLDTDVAAVWTRNKNEVSDRIGLFNHARRQMCAFIGIAPGPSLQQNNRLVRC